MKETQKGKIKMKTSSILLLLNNKNLICVKQGTEKYVLNAL